MLSRRLVGGAAFMFGLLALLTLAGILVRGRMTRSHGGTPARHDRGRAERGRLAPDQLGTTAPVMQSAAASEGRGGAGIPLSLIELEEAFVREQVKGSPLSAEVEIESPGRLPDGSRIVNRSRALIYRDADGRTRRDLLPEQGVSQGTAGPAPLASHINDFAAGVTYTLDHRARTVRSEPLERRAGRGVETRHAPRAVPGGGRPPALIAVDPGGQPNPGVVAPRGDDPRRAYDTRQEDLGQVEIEGVTATGTRAVTTVPAGAAGNTQPFEIVTERWYSPELQTVLLFKRSDPRFGESVYRLLKVSRAAPPLLFEVPAGYRVIGGAAK